jgi:hypothetical protein
MAYVLLLFWLAFVQRLGLVVKQFDLLVRPCAMLLVLLVLLLLLVLVEEGKQEVHGVEEEERLGPWDVAAMNLVVQLRHILKPME